MRHVVFAVIVGLLVVGGVARAEDAAQGMSAAEAAADGIPNDIGGVVLPEYVNVWVGWLPSFLLILTSVLIPVIGTVVLVVVYLAIGKINATQAKRIAIGALKQGVHQAWDLLGRQWKQESKGKLTTEKKLALRNAAIQTAQSEVAANKRARAALESMSEGEVSRRIKDIVDDRKARVAAPKIEVKAPAAN